MWSHGMSNPAVLSISPSATVFPLQAFANWGPALSAIALPSGIVKMILGPVDVMRTFSWNKQGVCAIRKNLIHYILVKRQKTGLEQKDKNTLTLKYLQSLVRNRLASELQSFTWSSSIPSFTKHQLPKFKCMMTWDVPGRALWGVTKRYYAVLTTHRPCLLGALSYRYLIFYKVFLLGTVKGNLEPLMFYKSYILLGPPLYLLNVP